MRRALPFLLALVLGVAAAALVACGSSGSSRRQFIPDRSAQRMSDALDDVRSAVDDGDCTEAAQALARARGVLVNLPSSVSDRLVSRLRQGLDNLQEVAPDECAKHRTQSQTTTTTETTTPEQTTATETTPTTTTSTTPTTTTSTTPTTTTSTTPTTTTTTTTPPPTTTTTPADPSGGTTTP
jgi:cell division septation protein DedD